MSIFYIILQFNYAPLFFGLESFFSHQRPFDVDDNSDDGMESQNEDDQSPDGSKDANEGEFFFVW